LIQGELGSFSHEAARTILPEAEITPCATAAHLFGEMHNRANTLALVPIENALAGSVVEFYDLLHLRAEQCKIKILREHQHRIRHNLIAKPGSDLDSEETLLAASSRRILVYSHPIALAQCRSFFDRHPNLPMQPVEYYDTAGSVKMILGQENPWWWAIASKQAAEIYGGQILREGIEDNPENYTRFLLLGFENAENKNNLPEKRIPSVGPPNKMSLFFSLKNRPGALVEALTIFSDLQMNLTKIESRPIQGRPWEYLFYVDVLFPKPEAAEAALARLRPKCETILDLGRYKAAELPSSQTRNS
jgi:prephenate dehydratase